MSNSKRKPLILGPGALTFGEIGTPLDMSCQLTSFKIAWNVDAEDSVATLCGEDIEGDRRYTYKLSGSVVQDLQTNGVIDWTWANKGKKVPFSFTPRIDTAQTKITGYCIIDPLDLGGDIGKRGSSDFEWQGVGQPELNIADSDSESLG